VPENFFLRRLCMLLLRNAWFDRVINVFIIVSSLLMMFQNPLNNPSGFVEKYLFRMSVAFTFIFASEMLIKMIAFGLLFGRPGRPAYLQNSWNMLDSFIVIISLYDAIVKLTGEDSSAIPFLKMFRMARMLRPLRIISRNENLKVVVKTIGASLPQLRILLVFSMMFFCIFALLGVSMFKGSFYTCQALTADGALEGMSLESGASAKAMCILPDSPERHGLRFLSQRSEDGCSADSQEWQRGTPDTPVCEVHCDGEHSMDHPFCTNTLPWGYNIMRCTDCRDAFCPGGRDAGCRSYCQDVSGHDNFCRDRTSENFTQCVDECEAECVCPDACRGLVLDAALCVEQGGRWINKHQHFDTLEQGMISLFEISTTEGWVDLMLASVDSIGPYRQPKRDENEWLGASMFISFILLGSFFVLNLCVGVIIDNYSDQKVVVGDLMVTETQAKWIAYQKALYVKKQFFLQTNLHVIAPTRAHLIQIVTSPTFERCIMACIIVNTICLGMVAHPSPSDGYGKFLDGMGNAFTVVFNIEAVLKLLALQRTYFWENWNTFDFFCVFVSDAFAVFDMFWDNEQSNATLATVISAVRIFRVARLFRLVRFLKGLNQLFLAFVLSIPKLVNVAAIMLLLMFLFAILGINLFAKVAYPLTGSYGHTANFRTFPQAMSLLVRAMTGEGWNEVMHGLANSKFDYQSYMNIACEDDLDMDQLARHSNVSHIHQADLYFMSGPEWEPNGCGSPLAYVYFILYTVVISFVILNLVIAVIFEGFEESNKTELQDLIKSCVHRWRKYDPQFKMLISVDRVFDFIDECVEDLCRGYGKTKNPNWSVETRWDPSYTGLNTRSVLAAYSMKYVKINAITVTSKQEVRFVVAVRAVLRRLICQGGLNGSVTTKLGRFHHLRELEALEMGMETQSLPLRVERELLELQALEQTQAHLIAVALNHRLGMHGQIDAERSFLTDVAAAKLQTLALQRLVNRRNNKKKKSKWWGNSGASAAQVHTIDED